jgi:hypothetical protein
MSKCIGINHQPITNMNTANRAILATCLSTLLFVASPAFGRVSVSTGGSSNGVGLGNFAGPKGINKLALTKASGGSINNARARAIFTPSRVRLGNQVIAKDHIAGDEQATHADANSVFVGVGTFKAKKKGARVRNVTIDVTVHGSLRCKAVDPTVPPGNSIAGMAVDIIADGSNVFSGTAIQDGSGPFTATGDIAGAFTTKPNVARIDRTFPINLGTLRDRQKVRFLFVGTTLVSFAPDLALNYAKADFYRTSSFTPAKSKKGTLTIRPAGKYVNVAYVTVPGPTPENVLFIESADTAIINKIDPKSVRVVVPTVGYFPGVPSIFTATPGKPGDLDGDSVPDVRLTIDQDNIDSIITSSNTVIVYGLTKAGETFTGTLVR